MNRTLTCLLLGSIALALTSPSAAQTFTRRPVLPGGPLTGLEMSLEGTMEVPRGGTCRFLLTLYEIVGQDGLRPARQGELRVLASYSPDEPVAELLTDNMGRAEVSFQVPEDQHQSFVVVFHGQARNVERRFELTVRTTEQNQVELFADRMTVAPQERVNLFGRALRATTLEPLANTDVLVEVRDDRGLRLALPRTLSTGPLGGFAFSLVAPASTTTMHVNVSLEEGGSGAQTITIADPLPPELIVRAEPLKTLVRPGKSIPVNVVVRRPNGKPVKNAILTLSGAHIAEPASKVKTTRARTDAYGKAQILWRPALRNQLSFFEDLSATVQAVKVGLAAGSATFSARVARASFFVGMAVEGGTLIPSLPGKVYVRVVGADGLAPPSGTPVVIRSELLGQHRGLTDASGIALFEATAEVAEGVEGRDRCGGTTATSVEVAIGEGGAIAELERCLPVDPDATIRVRPQALSVPAGGELEVSLLRVPEVRRYPTVIALLRMEGGQHVPLSHTVVPASANETTITIPEGMHGEVLLRARPLFGPERQELRGGTALVWVTLGHPIEVSLNPSIKGVTLSRGRAEKVRSVVLPLPLFEGRALLDRLLATRHPLMRHLKSPNAPQGSQLAGTLAARTPRDVAAPAVLRNKLITTLPAPDSPVQSGVLRDPWRARARFVAGRLGLIIRAMEQYHEGAIPDSLSNVAVRTKRGWSFNRELLEAVRQSPVLGPAGATTLGGAPLELEDIEGMDRSFTFDNMARRLTRRKLLNVLIALRDFVDNRDLDLQWERFGDPSLWLSELIESTLSPDALYDGWGVPMEIRRAPGGNTRFQFLAPLPSGWELVSAGPDGRFGTRDDFYDPFVRVLPEGSMYAIAAAEEDLLARLGGVELSYATISQLAGVFDTLQYSTTEETEVATSELGWTAVPHQAPAPDRAAEFERYWLPLKRQPGRVVDWSEQGRSPLALGDEPRRFVLVAPTWNGQGGLSWTSAPLRSGIPLVVDVPPLKRLRAGEPVTIPITVTTLPGGPGEVAVSVSADGAIKAALVEPEGRPGELGFYSHDVSQKLLRLEASRPGEGEVRIHVEGGGLSRTVTLPLTVDNGLLWREQIASGALLGHSSLPLTLPDNGVSGRAEIIVTTRNGLASDPRLRRWIRRDPALLAWYESLLGRDLSAELSLGLERAAEPGGAVRGVSESLSTACAVVAWASMPRTAHKAHSLRRAAVRHFGGGSDVSAATRLAALASGASGLPDTGGRAVDPVASHVGTLRDQARRALRTNRSNMPLLAQSSAALLLVNRRDNRGLAMLSIVRRHLSPGIRGGLVVAGEGPTEELIATAALAIAAVQNGNGALARELGRGLAPRIGVAMELGGEPLFWLLAAHVYGVFGIGDDPAVSVIVDGVRQELVMENGLARLPLELSEMGRQVEISFSAEASPVLPLARVEATYLRPFASLRGAGVVATVVGDVGYAGERSALEVTVEAARNLTHPRLLLALPPGAHLDRRALQALEQAPGVRSVAQPDRRGVVAVDLSPLPLQSTRRLPLAVQWLGTMEAQGFGMALFDRNAPWQMSMTTPQSIEVGPRPAGEL